MSIRMLIVVSMTTIAGCVTMFPYSYVSYRIGISDSCSTGSPMLTVQKGWKATLLGGDFYGHEQELLFTGVSANTLHLLYREYTTNPSGTLIRPAYSVPLQYDLNISTIITFRNLLIEIQQATPRILVFRILQEAAKIPSDTAKAIRVGPGPPSSLAPVAFYPPAARKLVRISTVDGDQVEGYLVGESSFKYVLSQSATDTVYSSIPKQSVQSMSPIGK